MNESNVVSFSERAQIEGKSFLEKILSEGARQLLQAAIGNEVAEYVKEHATGKDILVVVPADTFVRTNQAGFRVANFERLMVGMFITDVRVK